MVSMMPCRVDVLLVFGNEIIECPLAWRARYYGTFAFRPLLKEYFHAGAKWTAGPKPELKDELYDYNWRESAPGETTRLVITEFEPTFEAADFIRCGRDVFAQKSNVTNEFGIRVAAPPPGQRIPDSRMRFQRSSSHAH